MGFRYSAGVLGLLLLLSPLLAQDFGSGDVAVDPAAAPPAIDLAGVLPGCDKIVLVFSPDRRHGLAATVVRVKKRATAVTPKKGAWRKIVRNASPEGFVHVRAWCKKDGSVEEVLRLVMTLPAGPVALSPADGTVLAEGEPPTFKFAPAGGAKRWIEFATDPGLFHVAKRFRVDTSPFTPSAKKWGRVVRKLRKMGGGGGAFWRVRERVAAGMETRSEGCGFTYGPVREVRHPHSLVFPELLTGVSFDADSDRCYSLEDTRSMIDLAQARADVMNRAFRQAGGSPGLVERFHFWPNVLDLTGIFQDDADLFDRILVQMLAREPDREDMAARWRAAAAAGNRVYLARDFLTELSSEGRTYREVHFALALDLDARTVEEVLAHREVPRGLGRLHDPLVDDLEAVFAAGAAGDLGLAWEICLRGNFRRDVYRSLPVDLLPGDPDPEFFITRIGWCQGSALAVRDDPPDFIPPWWPDEGEPPPPWNPGEPPPPTDDPPPWWPPTPTLITPAGGFRKPPVQPWSFRDRELIPPPDEEGSGRAGGEPTPSSGCGPEISRITAEKSALDLDWDRRMADIESDEALLKRLKQLRGADWDASLEFRDPCMRAAYAAAEAKISGLLDQIANLEDELDRLVAERKALKDGRSPPLIAHQNRKDIWDGMIQVGGPWSRVKVACSGRIKVIGGGGGSVIPHGVTPEEQTAFQADLLYPLTHGKSWEEATEIAAESLAARLNREGLHWVIRSGVEAAMVDYTECMRRLMEAELAIYLPKVQGMETASAAELAEITRLMLGGFDPKRFPDLAAESAVYESAHDGVQSRINELSAQIADLKAEIEVVRLELIHALKDCRREAVAATDRILQRRLILEAFVAYCADPESEEARPWTVKNSKYFCEQITAMMAEEPFKSLPSFLAYLTMLKNANC